MTYLLVYFGIGLLLVVVELLLPTPQLREDIKTAPIICFLACFISLFIWPIGVLSKVTKWSSK